MAQTFVDISGGKYVPVGITYVTDSTGAYAFDPNSLAQIYSYNGSGQLSTLTVGPDGAGNSYTQTYTYSGSKLATATAWVKQ